jgi:YVTN family beta-propeller protein
MVLLLSATLAPLTDFTLAVKLVGQIKKLATLSPIHVGHSPNGIAYDPHNGDLYVSNYRDSTISVIDTTTSTMVDTIPLGGLSDRRLIRPG